MVLGGLISILIAIWIYKTAVEAKTGNKIYWVAGSVVLYLVVQVAMIYFNMMVIEIFDGDVSAEYDSAGGLNAKDNIDNAGLQSGAGGSVIGIIFELLPLFVPFFVVALIRQLVMLKQAFSFVGLFSGVKEVFISIKNSFSASNQ